MSAAYRAAGSSLSQVMRNQTQISTIASRLFAQRAYPLISRSLTIPSICIPIPGFLSDIWEGILRAVPKKKTSHMKKRHRQLAGKALKDVNAVNSCSGCGKPKKSHTLCPYCVAEIKESWKQAAKQTIKEGADGQKS